jgi:hypothetical protein
MRRLVSVIAVFTLILTLSSCKKQLLPEELPASVQLGGTYYTQFVIRYEKGVHITTNYRRGLSIPVNTPVQLMDITNKTILVTLPPSGQELLIKNAKKHTGDTTVQAFEKLFAKSKVDLSGFTKLERDHIKSGTVAKGMRKKAVLVAIGYPPQVATPSLDADQWTYWSSRFNKFIVHFKNGKVAKIQD